LRDSADIGLLLRRGAALSAGGVRVQRSGGPGVAAVAGAGLLALWDSEVAEAAGPGLFAGVPGCGNLGAATLEIPACFLENPEAFISSGRVVLERVSVQNGPGTGLVFFPGVQARLVETTVRRQELSGLFAWGATVYVEGGLFEDNAEHALEFRAYPDPRGPVRLAGGGAVNGTTVRGTRALAGPVLGGGILAQGATVAVEGAHVLENAGIGVSYANSARGVVRASTIRGNRGSALCLASGSSIDLGENTLTSNRSDQPGVCLE
jgi:hypothetical protein